MLMHGLLALSISMIFDNDKLGGLVDWSILDGLREKHQSEAGVPFLDAKEAYWVLNVQNERKFILVDVRTDGELLLSGTPKGSVNIVWAVRGEENVNFINELASLVPSKSQNIIFMCRSGVRSMCAAEAALGAGYENVYNLNGGFNAISVTTPDWVDEWELHG
ncbi:putative sulphurtransferase: Rhodanese-like domain [Candidatus Ichthyocystis hellenicum]|uniref:Putative sulphurtransferase: Rhodanese-like domain n=2 Tax=Candidatus Ichthyocystis hellenicum TaxID=1561003 RepID=A0A0S4M5J9_9BURK|nr:putative sulphurtransferase: Rhodanese-like domain [Candidatus Ichthyocystis hellenicum]